MLLAYLDPGSGSFFLQLLLAGLFGFLFTAKRFWLKLKLLFSRKKEPPGGE